MGGGVLSSGLASDSTDSGPYPAFDGASKTHATLEVSCSQHLACGQTEDCRTLNVSDGQITVNTTRVRKDCGLHRVVVEYGTNIYEESIRRKAPPKIK